MRDYAKPELFSTLSGHAQTHRPAVYCSYGLSGKLFGYNLLAASLGSVVFTSLTVIPIYLLARELYGGLVAGFALALFLITPNFVMFTGTSMDGPFSGFPDLESIPILQGDRFGRMVRYGLLTGGSLGLRMLMTYSTVVHRLIFHRCFAAHLNFGSGKI